MLYSFTDQQQYSIEDWHFDKLMQNDPYNFENETGILIFKSYHLDFSQFSYFYKPLQK